MQGVPYKRTFKALTLEISILLQIIILNFFKKKLQIMRTELIILMLVILFLIFYVFGILLLPEGERPESLLFA